MKILIAEDEQRARRGLYNLITSLSDTYEIIATVPDGTRALEVIPTLKPQVVFTDIKMPYMDGLSLIQAVHTLNLPTQFVIISAYQDFEMARRAISLGVTDYLVKPITYEAVEEVLFKLESKLTSPNSKLPPSLLHKYPNAHPLVLKALSIMEQSYATKLKQEVIAESLGITPEYFSYLFHKDVGEPFSKFMKCFRINIAKTLLSTGSIPKEDIPYAVGFSDYKYFSKVFKDITSMSVSDYLKTLPLSASN